MAAAALSLAGVTATAHPDTYRTEAHPATCDGAPVTAHVHRAHVLLRSAYALERWQSGPKRSKIRAAQQHRRCIEIAHTRRQLSKLRDRLAERLAAYAAEQKEAAALTPYDCGSHGNAAIPCYIVECESHFNWGAVNPSSGAFGWYQLLPSTYAGVCVTCDRSQTDQHRAAAAVYARSGGSEWVCA